MLYAFTSKSSLAGKKGREPALNKIRSLVIALVILVVLAGAGLAFLQFWDPPAPSAEVEKDLPHETLQK
jgi:hypothetical protein